MFIVMFDTDDNCWPMRWDTACDGAIAVFAPGDIALFKKPAEARRAINISTAFAKLNRAQGKVANNDFLEGRKHVRVYRCAAKGAGR